MLFAELDSACVCTPLLCLEMGSALPRSPKCKLSAPAFSGDPEYVDAGDRPSGDRRADAVSERCWGLPFRSLPSLLVADPEWLPDALRSALSQIRGPDDATCRRASGGTSVFEPGRPNTPGFGLGSSAMPFFTETESSEHRSTSSVSRVRTCCFFPSAVSRWSAKLGLTSKSLVSTAVTPPMVVPR
eukprot:gene20273-biopygen20561